jgi:hypothetical protein
MIVSASRRCDIPAYRMAWLMGALRAGSCEVRSPFDARKSRIVSLDPAEVDCLVFWTRDPRPLAAAAREIEALGFRFYAQVTITGYPAALEPGTLREAEAAAAFSALSDAVGPERALWRFDPVFVARGLGPEDLRRAFERLAAALEGQTRRVTLSLLDEYARTRARLEKAGLSEIVFGSSGVPRRAARDDGSRASAAIPLPEPYSGLLAELAAIARSRGIESVACAEPYDLSALGIARGACVDGALIEKLFGMAIPASRDRGQRPCCGCAPSVDIGAYGSCPAACAYCYARR